MPFVTRRRRCDQIQGLKPEADPSFHGSHLTFHGSWERAENDADGRGLFAAVEKVNIGQDTRAKI